MTLSSIFCLKKFRERGGVYHDPEGSGIRVTNWFWGAAKRIQKAVDKKQPTTHEKKVTKVGPRAKWQDCVHKVMKKGGSYDPYAVCTTSVGKPSKEKSSGGSKGKKVGLKKPKVKKPKTAHKDRHLKLHVFKMAADKVMGRSLKCCKQCEADSASANAAVTTPGVKKESLKILAKKFREGKADQSGPTKFRVVIIEEGMGNSNDAYYYTRDALQSAVDLFNGLKIYADHPSSDEEETRPERSTRDILGHYENVALEEGEGGAAWLCADVDILSSEKWACERMLRAVENAEKFPDKDFVGISINAAGDADKTPIDEVIQMAPEGAKAKLEDAKANGIDSVKVVRKINSAVSADMVTEAGAGGKILNLIEGEK